MTLVTALEETASRFSRRHKYTLGSDMRRLAYTVCRAVVVVNNETEGRARALQRLVTLVEELKTMIQIGKELRAFASFKEFERAAELSVALSKQSEGWHITQAPPDTTGADDSRAVSLLHECDPFPQVKTLPTDGVHHGS